MAGEEDLIKLITFSEWTCFVSRVVNDKPIAFVLAMHELLSSDDKMLGLTVTMARGSIFRPVLHNPHLGMSFNFHFQYLMTSPLRQYTI